MCSTLGRGGSSIPTCLINYKIIKSYISERKKNKQITNYHNFIFLTLILFLQLIIANMYSVIELDREMILKIREWQQQNENGENNE